MHLTWHKYLVDTPHIGLGLKLVTNRNLQTAKVIITILVALVVW